MPMIEMVRDKGFCLEKNDGVTAGGETSVVLICYSIYVLKKLPLHSIKCVALFLRNY